MTTRVLGINGSPRKGATLHALSLALDAASSIEGTETELLDLRGKKIAHCIHCDRCLKEKKDYCPAFEDDMRPMYSRVLAADGIILASPVYFMNVSSTLQAFLHRLRPLGRYIGKGHWAARAGGAVAVGGTRNGGQETTMSALNNFFFTNGMVVVSGGVFAYNGAAVWSNDRKKEGVDDDMIGRECLAVLGRRVAAVAAMLKCGRSAMEKTLSVPNMVGFASESELEDRLNRFRNR